MNDGTPVPLSTGKTMIQTNHAMELVRLGHAYMLISDEEGLLDPDRLRKRLGLPEEKPE